jgi:hypothetical protein
MKERPILFSAPMVRAILAGQKTQTRRALAPDLFISSGGAVVRMASAGPATTGIREAHCPYWRQPGDRLWVREAWAWSGDGAIPAFDRVRKGGVWFRADPERTSPGIRWRPSIHMPRWASRITLEVTGVRVERLQDISEADAQAEGVTPKWEPGCSGRLMEALGGFSFRPAASAYADLWEQINGPGSWDANPWVWVVEFRRVEA